MTMHLAHPALSLTGKRRGRQKWASAEHKRRAEQLELEWKAKMQKWQEQADAKKIKRALTAEVLQVGPKYPPGREPKQHIPSRDTGLGVAPAPVVKVYTGTKIKGIGTMHKSNAVPIFSDDEAKDIAHMRR